MIDIHQIQNLIQKSLLNSKMKAEGYGITPDTEVLKGDASNVMGGGSNRLYLGWKAMRKANPTRLTRTIKLKDGSRISGWADESSQTLLGYDKHGEQFTVNLGRIKENPVSSKYWLDNIVDDSDAAKALLDWLR